MGIAYDAQACVANRRGREELRATGAEWFGNRVILSKAEGPGPVRIGRGPFAFGSG